MHAPPVTSRKQETECLRFSDVLQRKRNKLLVFTPKTLLMFFNLIRICFIYNFLFFFLPDLKALEFYLQSFHLRAEGNAVIYMRLIEDQESGVSVYFKHPSAITLKKP